MKQRVLILAGYGPSLLNFRRDLIVGIQALGHEVVCSAPELDSASVRELTALGVVVEPLRLTRNRITVLGDIGYLCKIIHLCRRLRPEVVLAYTIKPITFGLLAARLAGVSKRFALFTGLGSGLAGGGARARLLSFAIGMVLHVSLRRVGIMVQNRQDRDWFLARKLTTANAIVVVAGSGVNLERFDQAPLPAELTFLMICRLLRDKGVPEFVAAARLLRRRGSNARFVVAGPYDSGPSALSPTQVEVWRKEGVVKFLGALSDVRPVLRSCSVFVLPSYYPEGVPRTILEALAVGRAIITTPTPGCGETVVEGVNGFLVPPRDPEQLSAAMGRFANNPVLTVSYGQASRLLAVERFDVKKVNAQMLAFMALAATDRSLAQ